MNLSTTLNTIKLETTTDLKSVFRNAGFVFPTLAFPSIFYIFFGIVMAQGNTNTYLLVSYVIFGVMGPALFNFGVNVATEREKGWLTLKRLSPMPAFYYLLAKTFTALCFSTLIFILLGTLAVVFANVSMATSQWLSFYALTILGTLPFCMLGLWLGLTFSSKSAPATVNLIYLPMAILSGLWLPIAMLPGIIQHIAWALPSYHLSQIGLNMLTLGQGHSNWVHINATLIFTLFCSLGAANKYKKG